MDLKQLVKTWFEKWERGEYQSIPVTENFKHSSPFGTIEGKKTYLDIVEANMDKFLDHRFEIRDELYDEDKACVRYLAVHGTESYEVSEWYYIKDGLIDEIVANFHSGPKPGFG